MALSTPASLVGASIHPVVRMTGFAFAPDRITVDVGTPVVWINDDLAPHTATDEDGRWDTGAVNRGGDSRVVFQTAGTFRYFCAFHPHMTGVIHVRHDS